MRVMELTMRVLMVVILLVCLAVPAFAAFQGPGADTGGFAGPGVNGGGFQGPGNAAPAVNVQQAKRMADDTIVTLTGNVVSHVTGTKDKYMFRDASGEIVVEIDYKYFRGQTVTPANTVRITGEVDKDFGRAAEIDVKLLEVLK